MARREEAKRGGVICPTEEHALQAHSQFVIHPINHVNLTKQKLTRWLTPKKMIPIPEDAESYEESQTTGYSDSQETLDQPGMLLAGSGGVPGEDIRETLMRERQAKKSAELEGLDVDTVRDIVH